MLSLKIEKNDAEQITEADSRHKSKLPFEAKVKYSIIYKWGGSFGFMVAPLGGSYII